MTLESTHIEDIFTNMKAYERENFGLKNGPDFPDIARVLLGSKAFMDTVQAAGMIGMLSILVLPKEGHKEDKADAMEKALKESPLRNILAEMFYAGFRFGKAQAEVEALSKLAR